MWRRGSSGNNLADAPISSRAHTLLWNYRHLNHHAPRKDRSTVKLRSGGQAFPYAAALHEIWA